MTSTTNAGTGVTRYLQVYTVLAQALAQRTIGAGQALPSEPTLVREYGVSRTTVRRALARLAAEGSIIRLRGSGTYARQKVERTASAREMAAILDDLRTLASNTTVRVLALKADPTPGFIQREWPEFGKRALMIRKIRYVGRDPVVLATSYVPEDIARALTVRRLGNDPVLVALEKLGHRAVSGSREVRAVAADPLAARHLELGVGAPLLNVKRLLRDASERILEHADVLYRCDRYELQDTIERAGHNGSRAMRR
jgi:GntR family transcriptional regulator